MTSEIQAEYKKKKKKSLRQEEVTNLEYPWNLFRLSSVYISLSHWSHMKQFTTQQSTKLAIAYQKHY